MQALRAATGFAATSGACYDDFTALRRPQRTPPRAPTAPTPVVDTPNGGPATSPEPVEADTARKRFPVTARKAPAADAATEDDELGFGAFEDAVYGTPPDAGFAAFEAAADDETDGFGAFDAAPEEDERR